MLKKEFTLKAYFSSYDSVTKKLTMLFLDNEIEMFTQDFLTKLCASGQNNPIKSQNFYVKFCQKNSMCFIDKSNLVRVPVQDLLDSVVVLTVNIKHYKFISQGKKIQGWTINLVKMNPA